jgi:hypothetical protein
VKCGYSREILALLVEDDLPNPEAADRVRHHVSGCSECRQYCDGLQKSQLFIKSRFRPAGQEAISTEALASMRRAVMAEIENVKWTHGWFMKLERFIMLGVRRQHYAIIAGFVVAAVISASLLGQMRHSQLGTGTVAVEFLGKHTLVRPEYREWVFVGKSLSLGYTENQHGEMHHNVYIDPAAYRGYAETGKFPEGTVLVMEIPSAAAMEVSVKDSNRFEGGWGFFDFTDEAGTLKAAADPLPLSAGCLSCHREKAETDHVFTQFYPVLRKGKAAQL